MSSRSDSAPPRNGEAANGAPGTSRTNTDALFDCELNEQPPPRQHNHEERGELYRRWETMDAAFTMNNYNFSVMSFNVLAQDLLNAHPELYGRHEKTSLDWSCRWSNLLEEMRTLNCDILCLQEVQNDCREEFFDKQLRLLGYDGIYKQRTGDKTDGCSIYYKTDNLQLVEHWSVEYRQPESALLDRDNIALLAKFNARALGQEFVVANTHLLYNPRRVDVRLAQSQILLAEIDRMAFYSFSNKSGRNCYNYLPVVIAGDFNSLPTSGVVTLMETGKVKYDTLETSSRGAIGKMLIQPFLKVTDDCCHFDLDNERKKAVLIDIDSTRYVNLYHSERKHEREEEVSFTDNELRQFGTGTLKHRLQLQSVYSHGTEDDPEGTSFQDEWVTVDYMFYNGSATNWKMKLIARYKLLRKEELSDNTIPNRTLGSDHFSLMAQFSLKKLF